MARTRTAKADKATEPRETVEIAEDNSLPPFDPKMGTRTPGFAEWAEKHPGVDMMAKLAEVYRLLGLAH